MKKAAENPLQGKLFMSAREIQATHDINPPDRHFLGTDVGVGKIAGYRLRYPDPRAGEQTMRPERTDKEPNYARPGKPNGPFTRPTNSLLQGDWLPPETDEQVYDRKRGEADRTGLTKSIKQRGVEMPVMLSTETTGIYGKPNIAGGHHRVAVMANLNPDQLMPVMPVNNVLGAKSMEKEIESSRKRR